MGRGAFGTPRGKARGKASAMAAQLAGQPHSEGTQGPRGRARAENGAERGKQVDEPIVCRPCAEPQTTRPTWWQRLTNLTLRTPWRLRGRRVSRERSQRSRRAWAIGGEWRSDTPVEDFEKNTDPAQTHIVRTNQGKWETSAHCFQCALNTVHECHDFGEDIHTFPGIERKWLSASVSEKVHYPGEVPGLVSTSYTTITVPRPPGRRGVPGVLGKLL